MQCPCSKNVSPRKRRWPSGCTSTWRRPSTATSTSAPAPGPRPRRTDCLGREQIVEAGERLHLDRVAAGVAEEHRRLFARPAFEAGVGFDLEPDPCGLEARGEG